MGGPGQPCRANRDLDAPGGAASDIVPPTPEFDDGRVRVGVEPPTACRPTLNLTAAGVGMTSTVELSLSAAASLASLLLRVTADATARTETPDADL